MYIEELTRGNQAEVRALILAGLAEHWGEIDPTLNPELDDMVDSYGAGRTILIRGDDGALLGTGTLLPRSDDTAEILRMSVAHTARRSGIGRRIVDELLVTAGGWSATRVILETTSAWPDVIAFYLSCGFAITHTDDGDFGSDTWFERSV